MKIIKKFTTKPSCFLVNDTTLPPDEILRLRKKIKSKFSRQSMKRLGMENYSMIITKKLQKPPGKFDKYKHLTVEKILRSNSK